VPDRYGAGLSPACILPQGALLAKGQKAGVPAGGAVFLIRQQTFSSSRDNLREMMPEVTQDLADQLAAGIERTRRLLLALPAGSGEYPLVKEALTRQEISFAIVCLDGWDRAGLVDAMRDLAGIAGDPGGRLETACRDIETLKLNETGLGDGIKNRVRGLLRDAEERAAKKPGNR
jgi:hypothetical protein